LMLLITAAALGLSLRHGAPTAVMGLIGGFATPLVVGDPQGGGASGPRLYRASRRRHLRHRLAPGLGLARRGCNDRELRLERLFHPGESA
jgi:hypothetical protein